MTRNETSGRIAALLIAVILTVPCVCLGASSVLRVWQGGTGAATLTGILKGNGTSAFTAYNSFTDNHLVRADGTGGVQNSGWNVADDNELSRDTGTALVKLVQTGSIGLYPASSTSDVIDLRQYGDTNARFFLSGAGRMLWGSGSATGDTQLSRGAANRLDLASGDTFRLVGQSSTPGAGAAGELNYQTTANELQYHNGSNWISIPNVASATRSAVFYPASFMLPTTAPGADAGTTVETTNEEAFKAYSLGFSAVSGNVSGRLLFNWVPPDNWDGGTVTARIYWVQGGTGTGDIKVDVDARSFADNETLDASWGTAASITDSALNNVTKQAVTATSSAITIGGTPAAGEFVIFRLSRQGGDAADTLNRSILVQAVKIEYTINAYSE